MILTVFLPFAEGEFSDPRLVAWHPATIRGRLFDCGGFPAIAHGMDGVVRGWIHAFAGHHHHEVLDLLDRHHGIQDGLQMRTIASADASEAGRGRVAAHAWHWTGGLDLPEMPGGDWAAHVEGHAG
jgi:hypothetical protein